MLRVREIIKDLSYDHLLSEGIIPDIITPMENYPNTMLVKKYSPFVYACKSQSNFSFFGYFIFLKINIAYVNFFIIKHTIF